MAAAALSTVLASLPVFLLGGLAVLVRRDLGFGELQLGLAVSVYFSVAAVSAVPAGRVVHRLGSWLSTVTAAGTSGAALLLIAVAPSYGVLLAGLALAGTANALAQIGSNEALARVVPARRQGLAFGIKQSAVPAATLLAGLTLPLVGLTLGWRAGFAGATLLSVGYVLLAPRTPHERPARVPRRRAHFRLRGRAAPGPLVLVAVAAGFGSGAASGLGAFLVESAVSGGVAPARAGLLLAVGSALGVVLRLFVGWQADARDGRHLDVVAVMLGSGAAGMALLATGSGLGLVPGTVLAFALGWGWPGLLNLAVVRLHPAAPAAATSVSQAGVFAGGALGPISFGLLVQTWSYRVAWSAAALVLLTAALLMKRGGDLLTAERGRAGPSVLAG